MSKQENRTGISLTPEWFSRLKELQKRDMQSSASAELRYLLMLREQHFGINQEDDSK